MSEERTKGLVKKRLIQLGYPKNQDERVGGVVYYKEDSYKDLDEYLRLAFSKASKKLTGNEGSPDYTITTDNKNIIIVIECKKDVNKHQTHDNLNDYRNGIGDSNEIANYSVNGALHYASYLNSDYDVIAVGISGSKKENTRVTAFVYPKGGELKDIRLLEDGEINDTLMFIDDYDVIIDSKLGRNQEESERVFKELSSYANDCSNYFRANGISAKDRAGFVSALVLALTNEDSSLYTLTKDSYPRPNSKDVFKDKLGKNAKTLLKESLIDIWDNKDNLPKLKRDSLDQYYNTILTDSLLNNAEGNRKKFKYGDNFLSSCLFSIYENIITKMKAHSDLDIMGTFYTVFLKYASGDAKDKGIVLTPKHITELFCDIAEYYLGKKLDDTTPCLDITTGTAGFLIGALGRMDSNIKNLTVSDNIKKEKMAKVREKCLIGVEREPEMFALAYANMRFHGDGKSNLYSCSSLLKHNGIVGKNINEATGEFISNIYLKDELLSKKAMVGMINPPYSLKSDSTKKSKEDKASGQSELDFIYSMLTYLDKGGIGIAIVPISCASNKGAKLRETILKEHTLLACMSMPKDIFKNSNVGTTTCIMVFRAHVKHDDSSKSVFLSRWLDDGFVTVPHSGRYDKNGDWLSIKSEWLRQLKGLAKPKDTVFMRKELDKKDECLAEAYIETDYSTLTKDYFESQLKKYALYLYMQENGLEE